MELQKSLTIASTGVLVLLNVFQFNIATTLAAAILAGVILFHMRGVTINNIAIYAFIIAELSPISLKCGLPTAIVYQLFSVALLFSLTSPFGPFDTIGSYKPALFKFIPVALALPAISGTLIYKNVLDYSYNQITSVSALSLFLLLGALAVIVHYGAPAMGIQRR